MWWKNGFSRYFYWGKALSKLIESSYDKKIIRWWSYGICDHGKMRVYVSLQIYYPSEWKRNVSHSACQQFCCFSPEVRYNSNVKVACSSARLLCIVFRIFILFAHTMHRRSVKVVDMAHSTRCGNRVMDKLKRFHWHWNNAKKQIAKCYKSKNRNRVKLSISEPSWYFLNILFLLSDLSELLVFRLLLVIDILNF